MGVVLGVNNFIVLFVADSCIFACCVFVGDGSMFERSRFFLSSFSSEKFCTENSELSQKQWKGAKGGGIWRRSLPPASPPPPTHTQTQSLQFQDIILKLKLLDAISISDTLPKTSK